MQNISKIYILVRINNKMKIKNIKKIKVHHEGREILLGLFFVLALLNFGVYYLVQRVDFWLYSTLGVSTIFYLLVLNFFRSPARRFSGDSKGLVIAPADGRVVAIEEVMENEILHKKCLQVSIFMSVFNVHANWYPVDGKITHISHQSGRFRAAYLPKSSTENERSAVVIEMANGTKVLARQIAGAVARRIVTYGEVGDECTIDHQMGFIKFGSRVDVYLPLDTKILVSLNDAVTGNQTILGCLKSEAE